MKKFSLLRLTAVSLAATFTLSLGGAAALAADTDNTYQLSHSEELRDGYHWECTESLTCDDAHHTEDCYPVCDCVAHFFPTCFLGPTCDATDVTELDDEYDAHRHEDGRICRNWNGFYYTAFSADGTPHTACHNNHTNELAPGPVELPNHWVEHGTNCTGNAAACDEQHDHLDASCYTHTCVQVADEAAPAPATFTVTYTAAEGYTFAHKGGTTWSAELEEGRAITSFGVWLKETGDRKVTMSLGSDITGTKRDNAALSATFPAGEVISELNSNGDATPYLVTSNGYAFGFFTFSSGTVIEILVSPYEEIITPEEPIVPAEPLVPAQPIVPATPIVPAEPTTPEIPSTPDNQPSNGTPEADVTIEEEDVPLAAPPELEDVADANITASVTETVEVEIKEESAPLSPAPPVTVESTTADGVIIVDDAASLGALPQTGTALSPLLAILAAISAISGLGLLTVSAIFFKRHTLN